MDTEKQQLSLVQMPKTCLWGVNQWHCLTMIKLGKIDSICGYSIEW